MIRDAVIGTLKEAETALRSRGVAHAALFGSVARGEERPDSDIDILVELAPEAELDLFAYVGIVQMIEDLFPQVVDVSDKTMLKGHVRPSAERDAVYAF
jgi:predicted nucleotidyltransferase